MTHNLQVALIQFPGSNCESETARALRTVGCAVDVVRWNQPASSLTGYDAYVIGGGFSYEDRVRAGVIAAKEPMMEVVAEEAARGKPILGICNGAQILLETGLVPGLHPGKVEMALATNLMRRDGRVVRHGHHCHWINLRHESREGRTPFTQGIAAKQVLPMTISHGEGRFTCRDESVWRTLEENDQIVWRYSDDDGDLHDDFPINPNGSWGSVAGICNVEGNVLAMMPHPERAFFIRQIPSAWGTEWGNKRRTAVGDRQAMEAPGPGRILFESLAARSAV
ncbi:MAG: phosphoribosylformylglycinamidine synthase I [bacterium]